MASFFVGISMIADEVLSTLTQIFNLIIGQPVLVAFFSLWVVRRIFKLFHLL